MNTTIYSEEIPHECCVCQCINVKKPNYVANVCVNFHYMCKMCLVGMWCNQEDWDVTPPCPVCREPVEVVKREIIEFVYALEEHHQPRHQLIFEAQPEYRKLYVKKFKNTLTQETTRQRIYALESEIKRLRTNLRAQRSSGTRMITKLDFFSDVVADEFTNDMVNHVKSLVENAETHYRPQDVWFGNVFDVFNVVFAEESET